MQFFAVASLFAAAASATTLGEPYKTYDITNFNAMCISHGGAC
jgi:hypothetical protein